MITVAAIKAAVAEAHRIPVETLTAPLRARGFAWPRQEAMFLCRDMVRHSGRPISLFGIGRRFGGRDHTTVLSALHAVERRLADPEVRRRIDSLSVGLLLREGGPCA